MSLLDKWENTCPLHIHFAGTLDVTSIVIPMVHRYHTAQCSTLCYHCVLMAVKSHEQDSNVVTSSWCLCVEGPKWLIAVTRIQLSL